MAVLTNQSYAYYTVPVNTTGIPGKKSTARPSDALGPDGTTDDGPPGVVTFRPFVDKYGIFSIDSIACQNNINIAGATSILAILLFVDETQPGIGAPITAEIDILANQPTVPLPTNPDGLVAGDYVLLNDERTGLVDSTPGSGGPPKVAHLTKAVGVTDNVIYIDDPTGFPNDGHAFDVYFGDAGEGVRVIDGFGTQIWTVLRPIPGNEPNPLVHVIGATVSWYPTPTGGQLMRKYECGLVIDDNGTLKIQRHFPPDPAVDNSYFEYSAQTHQILDDRSNPLRWYKLQIQHFSLQIKSDSPNVDPNTHLPGRFDMVIPSACVVACMVAVQNYYGFSPFTVFPLNRDYPGVFDFDEPPSPGLRTLTGASYELPIGGDLSVGTDVPLPRQVQANESIRCIYAVVRNAPTGDNVQIRVKLRTTPSGTYQELEILTILAGHMYSFDETGDNTPADRRMPYGEHWPLPPLLQQNTLGVDVVNVGSTTPGTDCIVYIET